MIYIELLTFHLFADDISIFLSHKSINEIEMIVNKQLKDVACWLSANKPSLNISKSSFLIFHPPQITVEKTKLKIYNDNILEETSTTYLHKIFQITRDTKQTKVLPTTICNKICLPCLLSTTC